MPCLATCFFADSPICNLRGLESATNTSVKTNCFAILVFGQVYILSIKLVKLQKKPLEGKVQYMDDMAKIADNGYPFKSGTTNIAIGEVNNAEVRQWAVLLALGYGQKAVIRRSNRLYYPLQLIHLNRNLTLRLYCSYTKNPLIRLPLTSDLRRRFLIPL